MSAVARVLDRMSPLDASFLFGEDGKSHMDVGMVLEFAGPPPSLDEVTAAIAGRLPLVPRYRQKVRMVPAAAALPVWVDDPHFDIRRHVVATAAAAPGDDEALFEAVGRVMSVQLARDKPLWEAHLVTGLAAGRWALVVRMHHCMVDGITSTAIVGELLATTPDPPPPLPDDWAPAPEPSDWELLRDAVGHNLRATGEMARAAVAAVVEPPRPPALPSPADLEPLWQHGQPPLDPTLTGPVGAARRFRRVRFDLDDVRRVRAALGGTVNDVLLATVAHAFRTLLLSRGEAVTGRSVRALMPVALKGDAGPAGGNRIGGVPVDLPMGETGVAALARIRAQTEALKTLTEAVPAPAQVEGPTAGLPVMLTLGSRVAGAVPGLVHTVASNVPGPQHTLYLNGRPLEGLSACISLWSPLRIAVQVLSYAGRLSFAAVADHDSVPDLAVFMTGAEEGLRELLTAAGDDVGG